MLLEVYKGNDPSVAHSSCVLNYIASKSEQASTLTQNGTGPVGPVTLRIYWSCKIFTGPTIFSLTLKEKIFA